MEEGPGLPSPDGFHRGLLIHQGTQHMLPSAVSPVTFHSSSPPCRNVPSCTLRMLGQHRLWALPASEPEL